MFAEDGLDGGHDVGKPDAPGMEGRAAQQPDDETLEDQLTGEPAASGTK